MGARYKNHFYEITNPWLQCGNVISPVPAVGHNFRKPSTGLKNAEHVTQCSMNRALNVQCKGVCTKEIGKILQNQPAVVYFPKSNAVGQLPF